MAKLGIVLWIVVSAVLLGACGESQVSPSPQNSESSSTAETAEAAMERLWPDMQEWMAEVLGREAIEGARPGPPVFGSSLYSMSEPLLVEWVLPDDVRAVSGDLFAAMRTTPLSDSFFFVSVDTRDRTRAEFLVERGSDGHWQIAEMTEGSGQTETLAAATRTLRRALGDETVVRSALFLPSGLAFAVGDNEGREAAVYLTFVNHGAGVGSFDKFLPRSGRLFTPKQLEALLTP